MFSNHMLGKTAAILILLACPVLAHAQQQPLSPPARSPVPLTDADQQRARDEEMIKKKAAAEPANATSAARISVPVAPAGRHVSSGNPAVDAMVNEAAAIYGLDPCLVFSVMRAESGFNRMAISPKGASGLMQLMPATAARFGVKNIFDPKENILGGAKYLRWLLDRFSGDVRLALAGYNAGEGAVEFYQYRIPPFLETQNYVRTIYARYTRIHSTQPAETPITTATLADATGTEKAPTYNQIIRLTSSTGDAGNGAKR